MMSSSLLSHIDAQSRFITKPIGLQTFHSYPIQRLTTDNPGRQCTTTKGLVYSLHEENKALKRMNRMPVGVMDGTSGVVSNNSFGKGKVPVPPFGSPERPRPDVTPKIAESFKSQLCNPELIRMYMYQNEDEEESMTTKDDDLLFYQDTFPVDKFVPYGKAMGSTRIEKSPTIPRSGGLGLCNTLDMG
ncbi:hypothetical protein Tco_1533278 [Tanacetum coccineum]